MTDQEDYRVKNAREGKARYVPGKMADDLIAAETERQKRLSHRKIGLTAEEWSGIDTAIPDIIEIMSDVRNVLFDLSYMQDLDVPGVNSIMRLAGRAVQSMEDKEIRVLERLGHRRSFITGGSRMTISAKQKAILHVAKSKLKLSDDLYRLALVKIAGVTTSNDLTVEGFVAVMGYFEHCGFRPMVAGGATYGNRPGFASPAQLELIRTLWSEYTDGADEDALCKWLERCFKVSSLRFLQSKAAPKVITALKSMKARAA